MLATETDLMLNTSDSGLPLRWKSALISFRTSSTTKFLASGSPYVLLPLTMQRLLSCWDCVVQRSKRRTGSSRKSLSPKSTIRKKRNSKGWSHLAQFSWLLRPKKDTDAHLSSTRPSATIQTSLAVSKNGLISMKLRFSLHQSPQTLFGRTATTLHSREGRDKSSCIL